MTIESKKKLKKKVWKVFSQYIRLKYADKDGFVTCYTCGKRLFWKKAQAGHAIGGRTNSVLFDEDLVRPQCYRCNVVLNGNYNKFSLKLIKENGLDWWEKKLRDSTKVKKYSIEDLESLYKYYSEKVKKLKKQKGGK